MTEPTLIPDLLRQRALSEPDRTAILVAGGAGMTYREWDRRSNAIARGLLARRVARGEVVALFFDNADWLDFAAAYFGVLKAGAVAVPLSGRFTGPHLASVLERCAAVGLVHGGGHPPDGETWHATAAEVAAGQSTEPIQLPATTQDLAEILYTSGTTGQPKGVACRHANVVSPLVDPGDWPPVWWRECAGGVYLHANAISTAGGQLRLFEPLGPSRMTTVALPTFDPELFCRLAVEHAASVVQLVPSMANSILDSGAYRRHDLSPVRVVSLGCAPLPPTVVPRLAAAFPRARLVNMYELSEARYAGTSMVYGERFDSLGLPRGRTQLRLVDPQGAPVPAGSVGEVTVRWPGVPSQHYFRDAAATAEVFRDGWTRTGDAGYLDAEGRLHLVDRIKDIVIKGGVNISTLEVENVLRQHRDVTDCTVFGVADPVHGEDVAAAVVLRRPVPDRTLRAYLNARLAPHQVPQRFLTLPELPRNPSGKVLKTQLRDRFTAAG
ncbi:MAG: class I adenylate-forming enzyme family protein [Micromonosporaceae bacterium]